MNSAINEKNLNSALHPEKLESSSLATINSSSDIKYHLHFFKTPFIPIQRG